MDSDITVLNNWNAILNTSGGSVKRKKIITKRKKRMTFSCYKIFFFCFPLGDIEELRVEVLGKIQAGDVDL